MTLGLSAASLAELAKRRAGALSAAKHSLYTTTDPVEWIETNFYVPELKGPIQLGEHQRAILRHVLTKDANGYFPYSTIVWADIKKSIKSCIAAAVGLWMSYSTEWAQVYAVANDLKQADSRVGYYMRRAIELNPAMKSTAKIKNYRIEFPNHSYIESIPIDPSGEAGSNADMVIFSELWGAHQTAQDRMWTEMTTPPNKFGKAFRWVETYAGYSGESLLLEKLYQNGVRDGEHIDLGKPDWETYIAPGSRMFLWWNTKPRMPWQTPEYYQQEAAILQESEFLRVHRNQFVSSTSSFVHREWWDGCRQAIPPLREREPLVFSIDAGVSSDCFAIVGVSRQGTNVYLRYARIWTPPKHGKLDFSQPEAEIKRLAKQYNVLEWAYDPYQLHDMATRLGRDGVGWFRAFSQGTERAVADKNLYDLIRERRLFHDGDETLTSHIMNANAETDREKLRLVKRSELLKIDLAVALSMASAEAIRLNIG